MKKKLNVHYIKEAEVVNTIQGIRKGDYFGITYRKADGSLRTAVAQRGQSHHIKITGTGETASEALQNGRIKYLEHKQGVPCYRQCSISRLLSIRYKGMLLIVDRTGYHII